MFNTSPTQENYSGTQGKSTALNTQSQYINRQNWDQWEGEKQGKETKTDEGENEGCNKNEQELEGEHTEWIREDGQAGTYWGATLLQYLSMPFLK